MKKIIITILILVAVATSFYLWQTGFFKSKTMPDKSNLIRVNIKPGQTISSPLVITGEARGYWFFEASFPVKILDENGNVIAVKPAQAQGEWMTENFVPFKVELNFTAPAFSRGTLVFEKDNPSGLPENADELRIPIDF